MADVQSFIVAPEKIRRFTHDEALQFLKEKYSSEKGYIMLAEGNVSHDEKIIKTSKLVLSPAPPCYSGNFAFRGYTLDNQIYIQNQRFDSWLGVIYSPYENDEWPYLYEKGEERMFLQLGNFQLPLFEIDDSERERYWKKVSPAYAVIMLGKDFDPYEFDFSERSMGATLVGRMEKRDENLELLLVLK